MRIERRITVDSSGVAEIRPTQIDAVVIGGLTFAASTATEEIRARAQYYVDDNGTIIETHTCKVVSMVLPQIRPDSL